MSITFAVDAVTPASSPLPLDPAPLRRLGDGVILSRTHLHPRLAVQHHGLVAAMSAAFRQHRPLLLTPDAVWLTLSQGVAAYVNANAERLRPHFVRHQGKKALKVQVESLDAADWEEAFRGFADAIAAEVGPGLTRLLTCDFSTTDPVTRVASQVVLMDTLKEYFDYEGECVCGIPSITLAGTPEDWRDVRRRVAALAEHDLGWWRDALAPLADKWVETAEGRVDRAFWQQMYVSTDGYGGVEIVEGWAQRLFYALGRERPGFAPFSGRNNPFADDAPLPADTTWLHPGVTLGAFPPGVVETKVRKVGLGGDVLYKVMAGFLALGEVDGHVAPVVGWGVREDPLSSVLARLAARIEDRRPSPVEPQIVDELDGWGAAVTAIVDGRTRFERRRLAEAGIQRAWDELLGEDEVVIDGVTFLPPKVVAPPDPRWPADVFAEVTGGSRLASGYGKEGCIVVHLLPGVPSEHWPVVALSFLELFQRMGAEGAYFLRPGYLPRRLLGGT
jgi:hypothetical protein